MRSSFARFSLANKRSSEFPIAATHQTGLLSRYLLTVVAAVIAAALAGPDAYSLDVYMQTGLPVVPVLVYGLAAALLAVAASWVASVRLSSIRQRAA